MCIDGNNTRRITWIITCNDKLDTIEISNSSSIKQVCVILQLKQNQNMVGSNNIIEISLSNYKLLFYKTIQQII